jgi:hypothetical protein
MIGAYASSRSTVWVEGQFPSSIGADLALQRKILAGFFKYDLRRILASEEGGIVFFPCPSSRNSQLKVQIGLTKIAVPVPASPMLMIS